MAKPRRKQANVSGGTIDLAKWEEIRVDALKLRTDHSKRDALFVECEDAYFMDWQDSERAGLADDVKLTISPEGAIGLVGALRLMIATDPQFEIPFDKNSGQAKATSAQVEKMARIMWQSSGRLAQQPVHFDAALSALMYAEAHILVTRLADMLLVASDEDKARITEAVGDTPYIFECLNPHGGYPFWDRLGLRIYHQHLTTTAGRVMDDFGEAAEAVLAGEKRGKELTLGRWWDGIWHVVWVEGAGGAGAGEPILMAKHGLRRIPIAAQITEGSRLFWQPERQRRPFLYSMIKSGMWNRANLALTVMYTALFAIGANPMFVYQANEAGKKLTPDWSVMGGFYNIGPNESIQPLAKNAIDASLSQGLEIANKSIQDVTIYRQALGQPMGAQAPYSMVALLHQAGRLPLVSTQRLGGWAIGTAAKIALLWLKDEAKTYSVKNLTGEYTFDPSLIPERFEIEARLDLALPQDMQTMVTQAMAATGGERPLASRRWAREKLMNVQDSDAMDDEIMGERAMDARFTDKLQENLAAIRARQEQETAARMAKARAMTGGGASGTPVPGGAGGQGVAPTATPEGAGAAGAMRAPGVMQPVGPPESQPLPPRGEPGAEGGA
jgi:hypothetical protein